MGDDHSGKELSAGGGIEVSILLTPGHTDTNLCVHLPGDEIVFTGDTVVSEFISNLEEGNVSQWRI